jgi:hypothetical protein
MGAAVIGEQAPLTATEMRQRLTPALDAAEAADLAARLRARFGSEALANGTAVLVDELTVGWAIAAPGASRPPAAVANDARAPATHL